MSIMSRSGHHALIGILIKSKGVGVNLLGGVGQMEQVCLNLKQRTPGLIRERLKEEERITVADVFIPKSRNRLNIYVSRPACLL